MNEHVQQAVIGIIVFAALVSVVKRMMPKWSRACQQSVAQWLDREGRSKGLRQIGQWLMPAQGSGGGCGSGCNTCGSCETGPEAHAKSENQTATKPLEFRRNP